jgi:hypothetical protein
MNICRDNQKKLCGKEECIICFKRSFASFEGRTKTGILMVDCWSEINVEKIFAVKKATSNKYKFKCCDCEHDLTLSSNAITSKGRWCKYCSNQELCNNDDCKICYLKSFASFKGKTRKTGKLIVNCWSKDNPLITTVFKGSSKKYKFKCCDCNHELNLSLDAITVKGRWCKYCNGGTGELCNNKKCDFCFKNSFASHKMSYFWSKQNKLSPRDVYKQSGKLFKFECECLKIIEVNLANINKNNDFCIDCKIKKVKKVKK